MQRAVFYSAGLHVLVVMVAYFGIPAMLSKPVVQDVALPVELVALEDVIKKPAPRPKPRPVKKKAPPPPPPEAKPKPPPPLAAPAPEPPPPPKAKPKAKPKPKQKAKPKPKPKQKAKPKPKPKQKVKPKPKPKPKRPDQLRTLLKNLAKRKEELQREQEKKQALVLKPPPRVARPAVPVRTSIDQKLQAQRLTAMVKQQLQPCWSIPGGVKDAYSVKVAVHIRLNTDGSLRGAPRVLDTNRMRTDRSFRAVAESAVRALHKCSPLKLPYDQYNLWQNITFNFDPSEALGP